MKDSSSPSEFDQYKDSYDDMVGSAVAFSRKSHDFFTEVKANYLLDLFQKELADETPSNVLDVGCGHGFIHNYLLNKQHISISLTGIDMASTVIEEAKTQHPDVRYDSYDGRKLPYDDDSFDAAFTICVIHHVPPAQWQDFLNEMHRVVRPGGLVIVMEHNPLNPLTRKVVNNCPLDEHAVLLKSGKLKSLFQQSGLGQIYCRFILLTPFAGKFFSWLERLCAELPIGAQYYMVGKVAPNND